MGNLNSLLHNNDARNGNNTLEGGCEDDGEMRTPAPEEDKPKSKPFMALLDPRSPTIGVSRTPVEIVAERERKNRLLKLAALNVTNTNSTPIEEVSVTTTTPSGFVDPRSPTFEYKRTPIAFDNNDGNNDGSMEQTPNNKELQIPASTVVSTPVIRDLRKRLFVSQLNDSWNASGLQEDNKEN